MNSIKPTLTIPVIISLSTIKFSGFKIIAKLRFEIELIISCLKKLSNFVVEIQAKLLIYGTPLNVSYTYGL